jgi:hypothetical protein
MDAPNSLVPQMSAHVFQRIFTNTNHVQLSFNEVPQDPPLLPQDLPTLQNLPHRHPLIDNLPPDLQRYGEALQCEFASRFITLQHLARYLRAFRYESRQLNAGFAPIVPPRPKDDVTPQRMCEFLTYATECIGDTIEDLYRDQFRLFEKVIRTTPQELYDHSHHIRGNPE